MRWICIPALAVTMLLNGCNKAPAEQCLDSFRGDLKDPESPKVISFEGGELIYTATNSYGARVKGRALCSEDPKGKWRRDRTAEHSLVADEMTARMRKSTACMKNREWTTHYSECRADLPFQGDSVDLDRLEGKIRVEMGF